MNIVPTDQIPQGQSNRRIELSRLYRTALDMQKICEEQQGVGLSAFQVGIDWNLFVIQKDGNYEYFVDCEYEPIGAATKLSVEGCLSIRKDDGALRMYEVERYSEVRITGKQIVDDDKLRLEEVDIEVDGIYAIVFHHEIDHAKNVLISDNGKEVHIW